MNTGMQIGTVFENHREAAESIIKIIKSGASDDVVKHALDSYTAAARVEHITVQQCTIRGDKTVVLRDDYDIKGE